MIGSLKGKITYIGRTFVIVETGGVGYKVSVTPALLLSFKVGDSAGLVIYTYVREDQLTLYGFSNLSELEFFEMLITVSGVGPKSALGIMSIAEVGMIKSAIASGDATVFTKVAGIGRKTAERVIVELKEKLQAQSDSSPVAQEHSDALDALLALGYSQAEAREALKNIPSDLKNIQDKVKAALKTLTK